MAFGRTVDNMRYSPLTGITPQNADQLGRAYTIDFLRLDPDTRRGQQSYPLAIGGVLYVTTNDGNVFAIDGATGKVLWQSPLPFGGNATPSTYEVNGRQFIVISAGGGKSGRPSGGLLVAFALPE